jgi:hypothetical protein
MGRRGLTGSFFPISQAAPQWEKFVEMIARRMLSQLA